MLFAAACVLNKRLITAIEIIESDQNALFIDLENFNQLLDLRDLTFQIENEVLQRLVFGAYLIFENENLLRPFSPKFLNFIQNTLTRFKQFLRLAVNLKERSLSYFISIKLRQEFFKFRRRGLINHNFLESRHQEVSCVKLQLASQQYFQSVGQRAHLVLFAQFGNTAFLFCLREQFH